MSELYKAIAGSPITYLATDVLVGQTTIAVTDDSVLPDAPNICTIGYGENIETIRYGAKSNGILQDVTRGLEGTPRVWKAGTEVARFYTAYEHNAIVETIKSHLAESAKKHITESGSNSNGRYIKFDDGTMICTGKIVGQPLQFTEHTATGLWRTDYIDFAYPQNFVGERPALSISSTSVGNFGIWMNSASRSLAQGSYRAFAMGDQSGNTIGDMYLTAIDRWR